MKLQVYDSDGSIGGGNKLADTLSKAFFGDGEAAAKIALARAQIEAQRKHADYYGANTSKVQQETRTAEEQAAANRNLAARAEAEAREKVQAPVPVPSGDTKIDVQGDTAGRQVAAPVPVMVQPTPAQIRLYEAQREAEAARARAVAIAGGNAQQVAQGINLQTGGLLLRHHANPTEARVGATLTTGNLPTTSTVVVPGDTAGVNAARDAAIAQDQAKPHWGTGPTGLPYVAGVGPDGRPIVREAPAGSVTAKPLDQASNEVVDARILEMNKFIRGGGKPTAEQADQYSQDMQTRHGIAEPTTIGPAGEIINTYRLKVPDGLYHPKEVRGFVPAATAAAAPGSPNAGGNASAVPPPANASSVTVPSANVVPSPAPGILDQDRITKAAPLDVPTTAEAGKARGYTVELTEALPYFRKVTPRNVPQNVLKTIASIPGDSVSEALILGKFSDPATKQYVSSALNVIYPSLRFKSGAVISKNEVLSTMFQQIPMPDDTQNQIDQKIGTMASIARGLAMAGYGDERSPAYQAWVNKLKARGFDINYSYQGDATQYVDGKYVGPAQAPVRATDTLDPSGGLVPQTAPTRRRKWNAQTNQFE